MIRRRRIKISVRRHRASEQVADRVRRLTTKLKTNQPLSIYSLFHGGGILDKALHSGGLERAGIKSQVDVAVEMNSRYMDVSIDRHPELFSESTIFIEGKIQDVWLGGDLPHADILVCGLPCTGASKAGRTKKTNSPKLRTTRTRALCSIISSIGLGVVTLVRCFWRMYQS